MRQVILSFLTAISLVGVGTASLWAEPPAQNSLSFLTATPMPTLIADNGSAAPTPEGDDFAPGLAVFALAFILLMLAVLGIGMVIGAVLIGGLALLTLMGIISTSVLVGLVQRRPGPVLSAFLGQLGAAIGAFCGVVLAWIVLFLVEWPLDFWLTTGIGVISGLAGGAVVGMLASLVLRWTYSVIMKQIQARQDRNITAKSGQDTL